MIIRIATRQSPLALWQSHYVGALLSAVDPTVEIKLVMLETHADQNQDLPISALGGKGAFSKEVQARVLGRHADIAVHSAKDLQAITPDGLVIGAFPQRGDARDALVGSTLDGLVSGATVATGSNRRQAQLSQLRPDLGFIGLRGNIGTRLGKIPERGAIIMAAAALDRLDEHPGTVEILDPNVMIPQVGQGALAIEHRDDDDEIGELLSKIDHPGTRLQVETERAFLAELGGDCDLPAGAYCEHDGPDQMLLRAMLSDPETGAYERVELAVKGRDHREAGIRAAILLRQRVESADS